MFNIQSSVFTKKIIAILIFFSILTKTKHVSTKQNVPDLPMPAEQCTMAGPTSPSRLPLSRTAWRYSKKLSGHCGTPKSGQVV